MWFCVGVFVGLVARIALLGCWDFDVKGHWIAVFGDRAAFCDCGSDCGDRCCVCDFGEYF